MNASVYIWGDFGRGLTLYPEDFSKDVISTFYNNSTSKTQLLIHRNNELMYYGYSRQLAGNSKLIGFCVLVNDVMYNDVLKQFPVFEDVIAYLVQSTDILTLNENGDVSSNLKDINDQQGEFDSFAYIVNQYLKRLDNTISKLPPINYNTTINRTKFYTSDNSNNEILNETCKTGFVYVRKDKNYNSPLLPKKIMGPENEERPKNKISLISLMKLGIVLGFVLLLIIGIVNIYFMSGTEQNIVNNQMHACQNTPSQPITTPFPINPEPEEQVPIRQDVQQNDVVEVVDAQPQIFFAVDLGLSVKWANCNLGAKSPDEQGGFFSWGELNSKHYYTEENSLTYMKPLGDISGDVNYDAARYHWRGKWRIPTKYEIEELINKCTWEQAVSTNGVYGFLITGPNGNSIFLPCGGWRLNYDNTLSGKVGDYWCSTPGKEDVDASYCLYFNKDRRKVGWTSRYSGLTIRPVCD